MAIEYGLGLHGQHKKRSLWLPLLSYGGIRQYESKANIFAPSAIEHEAKAIPKV
ncbi:uncharacterized protein CIMG_13576 [Coccidioides immitis RS]|uniref:Uncharacterized protein n=1 Tax=Coccidioides immitis (strain RS) TaxID=246410 RepID=A0A0D8JVI5_COCIM|nr:uncharacterized protein CIMG_13576 [Coccidioides immitis RS]KJF61322.1 hypothetical protein CIMG_13576 [Coccidioides immitis RS]